MDLGSHNVSASVALPTIQGVLYVMMSRSLHVAASAVLRCCGAALKTMQHGPLHCAGRVRSVERRDQVVIIPLYLTDIKRV